MSRSSLAAALVLGLAACGQAAEPNYFVLSAPPAGAAEGPAAAVVRVRLPDYLDRPQMVSRSGGNALVIDDDNRWGEPLSEAVPRVLAENLNRHLPGVRVMLPQEARGQRLPYEYLVNLDTCEPDGAGNAVMRGHWLLKETRSGAVVAQGVIDERRALASRGPSAAVAALDEQLDAASQAIAGSTAGQVAEVRP